MNDTQQLNPENGPDEEPVTEPNDAPEPDGETFARDAEKESPAPADENQESPESPESKEKDSGGVHLPIKIDGFSGPLDLLVNLIATHEKNIQEVAIAEITGPYLTVVRTWHDKDLNLAGEYLVLAATLLRYKSRSLLPREETPEEEEDLITDEMLRQRQMDYERFRQAAMDLRDRKDYADRVVPRVGPVAEKPTDVIEYSEVSVYDLYETFKKIIADLGDSEPPVIEDESHSVDEKMIELESFLTTVGKLHLPSYLRTLRSKLEVIVVFLALLELIRLRVILANQEKTHGDIWIVRHPNASKPDDDEIERSLSGKFSFQAAKDAQRQAEEEPESTEDADAIEVEEVEEVEEETPAGETGESAPNDPPEDSETAQ